ncbi:MAG: protein kinase [Myxococcaceae bacterium]
MSSQRDKLLGLLAVQLGFLPADALKVHTAAWAKSKTETAFGAWLAEQKILGLADVALLEACVAKGLETHGNPARALSALTLGAQAYTESFGGFDDTVNSGEHVVSKESLEGLEFVVAEMPGRYTSTDAELGRGGIGRVLAFKDHVLGRTVAWKELHATRSGRELDTMASMEQEARFLREARLSAQLEHPAIVPIYEAGRRVDGALYYTMRRIEGRTLASELDAAKTLDARLKLMPHLIAVTQALAYAHSRDVLHRDVKPQNVMLGKFGETYLLDWGLAKVRAHSESGDRPSAPDITGGVDMGAVGTPSYMSPEQAAGKRDIDHRTDVWGVGALLYQVLTGRPPYIGTSPLDCLTKILQDPVLPPQALEPAAPKDLVAVCTKALQRDPAQRYATTAQLAQDLQAWLEGRTVSAREYTPLQRAWRFGRRNRFALSIAATFATALVLTVAFLTWRLDVQRREARALAGNILQAYTDKLWMLPGAEDVVDDVASPALEYFRSQEKLSPDEELTYGQVLQALGFTNVNLTRLEAAQELYEECRAHFPVGDARIRADPLLRSVALLCELGEVDVRKLRHAPGGTASLSAVREVLDAYRDRDRDVVRWLRAQSHGWGRLSIYAQDAANAEGAIELARLELASDEEVLKKLPTDPYSLTSSASSHGRLALASFSPSNADESLALTAKALERIKAVPVRYRTVRTLRVWLNLDEQQAMMLGWVGRKSEAEAALRDAKTVYESIIAIEPKDLQARAVYADILIDAGRPCEARERYDELLAEGVKGSMYYASWVLAAVACGERPALLKLSADDVDAAEDPQASWLYALGLLELGKVPEATERLEACADAARTAAVQWPRGVLDGVPARVPDAARPAVTRFVHDMEVALRGDVDPDYPAFAALLADLKALPTGAPR